MLESKRATIDDRQQQMRIEQVVGRACRILEKRIARLVLLCYKMYTCS